jgi:hypothetical protein
LHVNFTKESSTELIQQLTVLLFCTDQAYVCLENRISHWKEAVGSKDAIITHNPLESEEASMLAYVGEKFIYIKIRCLAKIYGYTVLPQ